MKYSLTEKKVLKKLGIPDFRHMSKDKIKGFATMLPYMDPEVAKKALDQFPAFKDLVGEMVVQYKSIIERIFEENRISQKAFYDACDSILSALKEELSDAEIDASERERIENNMIKVASMIGDKDRENKLYHLKIIGTVTAAFSVFLGATMTLLGTNMRSSNTDEDDETTAA